MKLFKLILLIVLIIIIETLWPFESRPDLFLLFIITFSLSSSAQAGMAASFGMGFIQDILFSINFLNTLVKSIIALVILLIKDKLVLDSQKLSLILIAVFSPDAVFAKGLFGRLLYDSQIIWPSFLLIIFATTFLNLLFAPLLFYLIRRFDIYE